MTDAELKQVAVAGLARSRRIWVGSAVLTVGIYLLSVSWVLIFPAIGLGLALMLAAPAYAIITLVIQSRRRKRKAVAQPASEIGSDVADRAAHFSTVPQVLMLTASLGWLASWLVVGGFAFIAALTPTPVGSVYEGTFFGSADVVTLAPLANLGALALAASIPYHYSTPIRSGEQAALAAHAGAHRLIRFTRRANFVLLWLAAVGPLLLLAWGLIDQAVLASQINSGSLNG